MVSHVQLPPEIQLAQRLAGNEQVTRDRAVKKLRKYIVARTQRASGGFTHDELLKVWKGLFYCMWMQDKPLLQEELGRTISQLIHAFQSAEAQHLFLQTFWQTINREWTGIDRLRLDKYYLLMRMVLNESLTALKMRGWEERQTEQLLELLTTEILHPDSQAPNGVKSHFLEIFLEELTKVGADELTAEQNLRFIDPFCRIAARTEEPLVLHNITRGIFETIVEQAPFAIEDLMKELEEEEDDEMSEGDEEMSAGKERERGQDVPSKKPWKGSIHGTEPDVDEEQGEDDEDSAGPVLQFDYEAVANRLFEVASHQSTPSQNRKRLYKVIRKLQHLAEVARVPCRPQLDSEHVCKEERASDPRMGSVHRPLCDPGAESTLGHPVGLAVCLAVAAPEARLREGRRIKCRMPSPIGTSDKPR
ncbi:ribosomal RNA processing protein 1 homolog A isoform X4 [Equus przewalskii]|uniref:Ribosomal RNA processing 1 n=3 Tax=Equus TaxID=9789 RepID=A0A9L0TSA3_HORSE|nr:ribosomal RNA processing protein 1 homolog A isoform X4 [Equus caballus]